LKRSDQHRECNTDNSGSYPDAENDQRLHLVLDEAGVPHIQLGAR
jgi:hypothetical protein